MAKPKKLVADKFFRDKNGVVVIAQPPNMLITIWLLLWLTARLIPVDSQAKTVFQFASTISLGIWAVSELLTGVNYFRRILGLTVLLVTFASLFAF